MFPILGQFGSFIIPSWHIFFVLASLSGFLLLRVLTKTFHPHLHSQIDSAFMLAFLGGLLGARLFSFFNDEDFHSLTFYGGFFGAAFFMWIWCLFRRSSWIYFWDLMTPPLFLGLAIGRIGCFLNGDDFGIPIPNETHPWWSVSFPNHPDPIPRYPVQIMEAFGALSLSFFLIRFFRKMTQMQIGLVGSLGMFSYCVLRFFLEYLRGDERGYFIEEDISTSQGISLILASVLFIFYFLKLKILKKNNGVLH